MNSGVNENRGGVTEGPTTPPAGIKKKMLRPEMPTRQQPSGHHAAVILCPCNARLGTDELIEEHWRNGHWDVEINEEFRRHVEGAVDERGSD